MVDVLYQLSTRIIKLELIVVVTVGVRGGCLLESDSIGVQVWHI